MKTMKRTALTCLEVDILDVLDFEGTCSITKLYQVIKERNKAIQPDDDDICEALTRLISYGKIGLIERVMDEDPNMYFEVFVYPSVRVRPIGTPKPVW